MCINDILNLGSTGETVSNSILHIANQCKNYGGKEVSISSVTCTTRLNFHLINDVNNALRNKCQTSDYLFIDNNNIATEKLWKDGLHLRNSSVLCNNESKSESGCSNKINFIDARGGSRTAATSKMEQS